jgi:hypothetical protein
MLPDLQPVEGQGLSSYDVLLKCRVVVAHSVGQSEYVEERDIHFFTIL